ncbi:2,3-bisphosphoglycerate-independent phosphoglycerate mutase [Candidatus Bathyarchaeota archaeon]|nr:2,3-bisphosphoglycerate-independent phosphoglycerate mutase [Candidatus Bathyarchaeota archaeon]
MHPCLATCRMPQGGVVNFFSHGCRWSSGGSGKESLAPAPAASEVNHMEPRKCILLIMDGLGDKPILDLDGRTPLEAARTPHFDELATRGACGIMDVVEPGMPVGSDIAHLLIFGYTREDYPGRGPLEALGVGMELQPGDVALRGNLANIDQGMNIIDRRAGRRIPEAGEIITILNNMVEESGGIEGVKVEFRHSTEQRVACVLRGPGISHCISDTNPNRDYVPVAECKPLDDSPEARKTARVINNLTKKIYESLKDNPINKQRKAKGQPQVNCILTHGAGMIQSVPSFQEKFHVRAACVTGNGVIRGVCRYLGINVMPCPGATGTINTDLEAKIETLLQSLQKVDIGILHIKATDSSGHDNKPFQKKEFLENIDSIVGHGLVSGVDWEDTCAVITADHSTPCENADHSGDPVPVLIVGKNIIHDEVRSLGERSCAGGYLGRISSHSLMNMILNRLGRQKKFGA